MKFDLNDLKIPLKRAVDSATDIEGKKVRLWLASQGPKIFQGALSELINSLKLRPELNIFDEKMRIFINTRSRLNYEGLVEWLVIRAKKQGTDRAIEDLERYLEQETFECMEINAIGGIEIDERIPLANNIELIPLSEIPDSFFKSDLQTPQIGPGPFYGATAALVRPLVHPRIHINPDEVFEPIMSVVEHGQLEDGRLSLTLVGVAPVSFGSWFNMCDNVPCQTTTGMACPSSIEVGKQGKIHYDDYERARKNHEMFIKLDANIKDELKIALSRLNSAMRRGSIIDSIIDLGIAMEALFINEKEVKGEYSFKLSARAARLLGNDEKERKELFKLFGFIFPCFRFKTFAFRRTASARQELRYGMMGTWEATHGRRIPEGATYCL